MALVARSLVVAALAEAAAATSVSFVQEVYTSSDCSGTVAMTQKITSTSASCFAVDMGLMTVYQRPEVPTCPNCEYTVGNTLCTDDTCASCSSTVTTKWAKGEFDKYTSNQCSAVTNDGMAATYKSFKVTTGSYPAPQSGPCATSCGTTRKMSGAVAPAIHAMALGGALLVALAQG